MNDDFPMGSYLVFLWLDQGITRRITGQVRGYVASNLVVRPIGNNSCLIIDPVATSAAPLNPHDLILPPAAA